MKKKPKKKKPRRISLNDKYGRRMEFDSELEAPCPCGGKFNAGFVNGAGDNRPAVMHSSPHCEAFDKLEPEAFLTYVRRSFGITDDLGDHLAAKAGIDDEIEAMIDSVMDPFDRGEAVAHDLGQPEGTLAEWEDLEPDDTGANILGQPAGDHNVEDDMLARLDLGRQLDRTIRRQKAMTDTVIASLRPREREVLRKRFGIDIKEPEEDGE